MFSIDDVPWFAGFVSPVLSESETRRLVRDTVFSAVASGVVLHVRIIKFEPLNDIEAQFYRECLVELYDKRGYNVDLEDLRVWTSSVGSRQKNVSTFHSAASSSALVDILGRVETFRRCPEVHQHVVACGTLAEVEGVEKSFPLRQSVSGNKCVLDASLRDLHVLKTVAIDTPLSNVKKLSLDVCGLYWGYSSLGLIYDWDAKRIVLKLPIPVMLTSIKTLSVEIVFNDTPPTGIATGLVLSGDNAARVAADPLSTQLLTPSIVNPTEVLKVTPSGISEELVEKIPVELADDTLVSLWELLATVKRPHELLGAVRGKNLTVRRTVREVKELVPQKYREYFESRKLRVLCGCV